MPQSINRTTSRLARETRGQEIAEAALVLPIVFMVMLGIFWFGQAFRIYGTITHAAREGARAAVKLLPGWGNAISGGVAAAGTYGIGRAAGAYFIEGISLGEVRKLFRRKRRDEIRQLKSEKKSQADSGK